MKNSGLSDSLGGLIEPSELCPDCGQSSTIEHRLCVNCLLKRAIAPDETSADDGASLEQLLAEIDVPDREWRLGNYEILEEIARGGMGVVYRARQRHSRRIVALKRILSFHADSRETLERFRREAEAAASLDHPNILPIYEVSESEGLPFFSMKYAAGGSLRDVGAALRSDPRECVALLAKVSRATEYAHRQGILHRDLKPGNILLDSRGEPLVSDFGLAKWLDTSTDLTRTLTVFGTPGYIAPEQAEGATPNLTPAADVYSLGAVLFDLLTGRPPFLGEHALAVIKQAAEKPAPKLRSLVPTADRDLETICARCLEREPAARYQSAAELAHDLECWLGGKPIKARRVLPPTRVWRWSRRNPKLVATAATCLFLGAASIWFLWQQGWVRQISSATKKLLSPREAAEESKLHQALVEYPLTQDETEQSHVQMSPATIQERLYRVLATIVGLDAKLLRDKLPRFSQAVKRDPNAPSYERACAAYLGRDYAEAERLFLTTADETGKANPMGTHNTIRALILAGSSAKRSTELGRAREHLAEAEKLTDRKRIPLEWAEVQYAIADVLLTGKDHAGEAEKLLRAVIESRTQIYGREHRETLIARRRLALSLQLQAKYAEAEAEWRQLLSLDEKIIGPENPETLKSRNDLRLALSDAGKHADALIELQRLVKLQEKVLGPEHRVTLATGTNIGVELADLGRFSEAIAKWREHVKVEEKVLGPDDELTLTTIGNLGQTFAETGEYREAEAMLRRAYTGLERTLGPADDITLSFRGDLVVALAADDKDLEAETEASLMVKTADRFLGAERSGWCRNLRGAVWDKQGKHKEAEAEVRQAFRLNEKGLGTDNRDTLNSRGILARNLWYQRRNVEAETLVRELITANEKVLGAEVYFSGNNVTSRIPRIEGPNPLECRTLFANTLRDQQKYAEAEAEYKEVIQLEEKVLGPENRDTLNACYQYAYQLAEQGKRDEARALAERAAKGAAKILPPNDPDTREYEKFLETLDKGHPISTPYMKFHEIFWVGKRT